MRTHPDGSNRSRNTASSSRRSDTCASIRLDSSSLTMKSSTSIVRAIVDVGPVEHLGDDPRRRPAPAGACLVQREQREHRARVGLLGGQPVPVAEHDRLVVAARADRLEQRLRARRPVRGRRRVHVGQRRQRRPRAAATYAGSTSTSITDPVAEHLVELADASSGRASSSRPGRCAGPARRTASAGAARRPAPPAKPVKMHRRCRRAAITTDLVAGGEDEVAGRVERDRRRRGTRR